MGGIDKSDMLAQLYHSPMKSKKWYMRLFTYYLNFYACNARLYYWRDYESLGETKLLSLKKNIRLELFRFASSRRPNVHHRRRTLTRLVDSPERLIDQYPSGDTSAMYHLPLCGSTHPRFTFPVIQGRQTCKHYSRQGNIIRPSTVCLPGLQDTPLPQCIQKLLQEIP